jgi:hypothetical protein
LIGHFITIENSFLFFKKKKCKDLDVSQDLTEFAKRPISESLKKKNLYIFKKKNGILEILTEFNEKS